MAVAVDKAAAMRSTRMPPCLTLPLSASTAVFMIARLKLE
jgi:hypothetical protein